MMAKEFFRKKNTEHVASELNVEPEELTFESIDAYIKNPDTFAKRLESTTREFADGLIYSQKTVELGDGNFTNVFSIAFSRNDKRYRAETASRKTPLYQHRLLKNDPSIFASMNGAFFFLADGEPTNVPDEVVYNLHMRKGKILGLPSADRPALITTRDGIMTAHDLKAEGILETASTKISWVGGERHAHTRYAMNQMSPDLAKHDAVLYNSACCSIEYENPHDKSTLRIVNEQKNSTPHHEDARDYVIKINAEGNFYVASIHDGGGTDFFSGAFILQTRRSTPLTLKVGDEISPKILSGLDVSTFQSALTTGPSTNFFLHSNEHPINTDFSLGTFPPFNAHTRYARSIAYEDVEGYIHFLVCDAVPRSIHMKGVTPKEAALLVPENARWSVFLDGGQSSRITIRDENTLAAYGNKQYVRLHKLHKTSQGITPDSQYLWTGKGRPVCSMLELKKV